MLLLLLLLLFESIEWMTDPHALWRVDELELGSVEARS